MESSISGSGAASPPPWRIGKKWAHNNEACRFQTPEDRRNGSHHEEDEAEEALAISIKVPATVQFSTSLTKKCLEEVWHAVPEKTTFSISQTTTNNRRTGPVTTTIVTQRVWNIVLNPARLEVFAVYWVGGFRSMSCFRQLIGSCSILRNSGSSVVEVFRILRVFLGLSLSKLH